MKGADVRIRSYVGDQVVFHDRPVSRSSRINAFQLEIGYSPYILGIKSSMVPEELMAAHVESVENRAVQKIFRSHNHGAV